MNLPSLTWNGQLLHHSSKTLSLMEWMLFMWCFGSCSLSIFCNLTMFFLLAYKFKVHLVEKNKIEINTLFQGFTLSILFPCYF